MLFDYPDRPHVRIHSPAGYDNYESYKPWLRDEFRFRCVYCLYREMFWAPDGEKHFGVDHIKSRSGHPSLICAYSNLVYACNVCNSLKQDDRLLHPCETAFSDHLRVLPEGQVKSITREGLRLIKRLNLDSPQHEGFRKHMIRMYRIAREHPASRTAGMVRYYFRYPESLPDLSRMRPPENHAVESIEHSHFSRRRRGELGEIY